MKYVKLLVVKLVFFFVYCYSFLKKILINFSLQAGGKDDAAQGVGSEVSKINEAIEVATKMLP